MLSWPLKVAASCTSAFLRELFMLSYKKSRLKKLEIISAFRAGQPQRNASLTETTVFYLLYCCHTASPPVSGIISPNETHVLLCIHWDDRRGRRVRGDSTVAATVSQNLTDSPALCEHEPVRISFYSFTLKLTNVFFGRLGFAHMAAEWRGFPAKTHGNEGSTEEQRESRS